MATTMTQRLPRPVSLVGWVARRRARARSRSAVIALNRGETINALWFIVAAVCVYALGYRFYSAFLAAQGARARPTRATPAERFNDGRDFVPTNRWIVFGHHFAAIAGPGPLVGPTLAAQFGYLPGTLWILIGAVLGGCVQDFVAPVLLDAPRRPLARPDGARRARAGRRRRRADRRAGDHDHPDRRARPRRRERDAAQPVGDVHGRRDDPDRDADRALSCAHMRPGRVLEGSAIGVVLLLLAVFGGGWVDDQPDAARLVRLRRRRRSR